MAEGELRGATALASREVLDELVRSSTESELDDGLDDRHQTVLAPAGYHHQIVTPGADVEPALASVPRATPPAQPAVEPPVARGSLREMRAVPLDEVLDELDDGDRSMSLADLASIDDEEPPVDVTPEVEVAPEQHAAPVVPVHRGNGAWRWLAAFALVAGAALAAYVAL